MSSSVHELQDDLEKVREEFENARSNLEKEQAEKQLLLAKLCSDDRVSKM